MKKSLIVKEKTWVEIDSMSLMQNIENIRSVLDTRTDIMAVVKANAYGHGLLPVLEILESAPVDSYAVFDFNDALVVRSKSSRDILVLSNTTEDLFSVAAQHHIAITVSSVDVLKKLSLYKGRNKLRIHIKIDTGLGRQGFIKSEQKEVFHLVEKLPKTVIFDGLYTHFSGTEEKKFDTYTTIQVGLLEEWRQLCNTHGYYPKIHAGATSGTLRFKEYPFDIARIGIGMYGLWPSKSTKQDSQIELFPVMSFRTTVTEVKKLSKGSCIAYDCTHVLAQDSTIALLPVGYYDGIPRSLSNKGYVLIHGKKAPILGRIMMNMCVIDVTHCGKVQVGDVVTLIGNDKGEVLSADEFALLSGTINYEIVTRINPLITRVIV